MTARRKKVVHVISKFGKECWGGAETALLNVCPRLAEQGFDCEVWSPMVFSNKREEVMDGVVVRRFPGFYLSSREEKLAGRGKSQISFSLLWAALTRRDIDLIHLHCHNRLASLVTVCGLIRGIPSVVTLHFAYKSLFPRWRYFFPTEFAIRNARLVISVSEALRDGARRAFPSLPPDRFTCIRNGANVDRLNKNSGEGFRAKWGLGKAPVVLNVGRICGQKNQPLLVGVFPKVLREVPEAHLVLVGPDADHEYYQRVVTEIEGSPCRSQIHLIPGLPPESDELRDAYAAADVFVLPSLEEGAVPLVVLEAWAAARPVLASNVVPNWELVEPGNNGLLFDLARAPEELPGLIVEVLRCRDRSLAWGEAGRRGVLANYTWDAIATQLAATYRDLLP